VSSIKRVAAGLRLHSYVIDGYEVTTTLTAEYLDGMGPDRRKAALRRVLRATPHPRRAELWPEQENVDPFGGKAA